MRTSRGNLAAAQLAWPGAPPASGAQAHQRSPRLPVRRLMFFEQAREQAEREFKANDKDALVRRRRRLVPPAAGCCGPRSESWRLAGAWGTAAGPPSCAACVPFPTSRAAICLPTHRLRIRCLSLPVPRRCLAGADQVGRRAAGAGPLPPGQRGLRHDRGGNRQV